MDDLKCPYCGKELTHEDTFGNLDHCLNSIGYHSDWHGERHPIKRGDIYKCENEECESQDFNCYFYTLDSDVSFELYEGYPC